MRSSVLGCGPVNVHELRCGRQHNPTNDESSPALNMPPTDHSHSKAETVTRISRSSLLLVLLLGATLVVDGVLLWRRQRYLDEAARLRVGMSALESKRADAILSAEADQSGLMLQLLRQQAAGDDAIHLAINTDSSSVALESGLAQLRVFHVDIGPERRVGVAADTLRVTVPRGTRSVENILSSTDTFELPAWLWTDRGMPIPAERRGVGWTGPGAIVTSGGTLIYSIPTSGPLADSSYVMPGAIRVAVADLEAIRGSLARGMKVYFF